MGLNANDYYVKWTEAKDFRWVLTEPGRDAPYVLRYDGPDGRLYENRNAKPRFYSDEAIVTVTIATPTDYTLAIDAAKPARIMSTSGVERVGSVEEGRFCELRVPAGHTSSSSATALHIYAAFAVALATLRVRLITSPRVTHLLSSPRLRVAVWLARRRGVELRWASPRCLLRLVLRSSSAPDPGLGQARSTRPHLPPWSEVGARPNPSIDHERPAMQIVPGAPGSRVMALLHFRYGTPPERSRWRTSIPRYRRFASSAAAALGTRDARRR